jgi:TRAP-type C4-dicarboxylate transport system permease small subunit
MMLRSLVDKLSDLLVIVAGLALVAMMTHVTSDVIGKYFFSMPIPGTAEVVASYYMIATVFLPLAYIEVHRRPIVVDLVYNMLPGVAHPAIDLLGTIASGIFYGFLAWQSTLIALNAWEIGEIVEGAWRVVVWPSRFLLPLGLALACIVLILRAIAEALAIGRREPGDISNQAR